MATSKSKTKPSSEGAATQKPRRTASKASSATTPESPSPKRARTSKAASAAAPAPVPTPSAPEPDAFQPQQAAPIHASERHRYVQEAAYFRAERRGFVPGFEHEDWLQAEAEVDARLHGRA